jgi:hypothetical protein
VNKQHLIHETGDAEEPSTGISDSYGKSQVIRVFSLRTRQRLWSDCLLRDDDYSALRDATNA